MNDDMDNQPVFKCPFLNCAIVISKGSSKYSDWHTKWFSSQGALQLDCPTCGGRLIQCHYCGLIYENVRH